MLSKCDSCNWRGDLLSVRNAYPDIPDLLSRLEPGGAVPSCECPECGALAYPVGPAIPYTVTAKQLVEDEDLSNSDDIQEMSLGLGGIYTFECSAMDDDDALDQFHRSIPLGNLEDYEASAAPSLPELSGTAQEISTVNVIVMSCGQISSMKSWADNDAGVKAAQEYFKQLILSTGCPADEVDDALDEGIFEVEPTGHDIIITHSC